MGLSGVGLAVCDDPNNAIDSDDTTFAVLHNHAVSGLFWDLAEPNTMDISGFTAVA
jgi:hypothetical protein